MKKNKGKERMEIVLSVLFPSFVVGDMFMYLYAIIFSVSFEINNAYQLLVAHVICSLIAAIYFSVKAAIYYTEHKVVCNETQISESSENIIIFDMKKCS